MEAGKSHQLGRTEEGRRVTSYDVAKAAGVSQSAVSRCYKPGGNVSDETRAKVMEVARKLGFQPNAIARIMTTQRSNMVAVIINNSTNLCYPELLVQLSRRFDERGIHVLLFTREQEKDIDNVLDQVWQYQIDGVICAARLSQQQALFFEQRGIPLVFYNYYHRDFPASAICCDNEGGERILVDRLYKAGHRSFAIVSGHKDVLVNVDRTQGALARLHELGIGDIAVYVGDNSYDSGGRAFREMMRSSKGAPDALICANDAMAMGCMDVARYEYNLHIPEHLSVVGFDGAAMGTWPGYKLTTIEQPLEIMVEAAVNMLMARVDNPQLPPERRTYGGVFMPGESARIDLSPR